MRRHKGVTLLEMLIVIVIIGIISASMYFSVINMSASADANKIINDMIMLKQAVLTWYKFNLSRITYDSGKIRKISTDGTEQDFDEFVRDHSDEILKYLENTSSLIIRSSKSGKNDTGDYALITMNNYKEWYVCCNMGTTSWTIKNYGEEAPELEVKKKLAGKAKSLGLFGKANIGDKKFSGIYTDQKFACMLIIKFN